MNRVSKPRVTGTGTEYHIAPALDGRDGVRRDLTRQRFPSASGDCCTDWRLPNPACAGVSAVVKQTSVLSGTILDVWSTYVVYAQGEVLFLKDAHLHPVVPEKATNRTELSMEHDEAVVYLD